MKDILEDKEFYELMQTYRWSELPMGDRMTAGSAASAFEDVKTYLRANCVVPLSEDVRTDSAMQEAQ